LEIPVGLVLLATSWLGTAALILATAGLAWAVLAERMMTRREASYAILIAATFAADWLTLLCTVDQHLSAMPPTIAALMMVSPALLPLTASVLAAW
jgi:hypothetical protein